MSIRAIDIADPAWAGRVLALQRLSYRTEAELIGRDDIPPLHETIEELQACGEHFCVSLAGTSLAGAVAYKIAGDTLDLHRVMVHPQYLRRGIASALIGFVAAREHGTRRIIVSTASRNTPARRLYARLGFRETGEHEVAPGLWIIGFEKMRDRA